MAAPLNVLLMYSGYSVPKSEQWTGSTGIWDREHLWPQSYGLQALNTNSRARRDIFNLFPCDVSVNSSRGNKYYDTTTPPGSSYPDAPESSYDFDSWEPRTADKGPIARATFYMAVRYAGTDPDVPDLELSDSPNAAAYVFGKLRTLLAWNRQFPVTDAERERNQIIYESYQHNRNPFVDDSDFADRLFLNLPPYTAWKNGRFTGAELLNPDVSSDLADPDRDGLGNLLEFIFQSDPRKGDGAAPLVIESVVDNPALLGLRFLHNRFATDVTLSYEGSQNLVNWSPLTPTDVTSVALDFDTEELTVLLPVPASSYFVRVRATPL